LTDEESFRKSLNELGEEAVKRNLARSAYEPRKTAIAELWLADRDDERMERFNVEGLKIARSSKDAAWVAAIAAIIAVPIAIISLAIAYLSWVSPHH
jgi:hypothetical protein